MGLAIVAVIQEKTRWVASSLRKLRSKRSRKATEATELQPIALAGASKGFTGSSRQCNTFARTPSGANPESHQHWTDSSGSKAVTGEWEACRMCTRKFMPSCATRRFSDFCSLDCKSAFMLGHDSA